MHPPHDPRAAPETAPGPPADEASSPKREAVLAAAAKVFLEQGFEAASMDEVARRAAVSKATIYSHFESKTALFNAIVTARCQRMMPAIAALGGQPPRHVLTRIGRQFLDLLVSPEALPLYRVVLAEAPRFPDLGRAFYAGGPDRTAAALADYLRRQHDAGVLDVPDARLAAEQFFGMVLAQNHVRLMLGLAPAGLAPAERDRIVAQAVAIFLNGTARRAS